MIERMRELMKTYDEEEKDESLTDILEKERERRMFRR